MKSTKQKTRTNATVKELKKDMPGYFGKFGGRFVPETLIAALDELEYAYTIAKSDASFQKEFHLHLRDFAGRPTSLLFAERLSAQFKNTKIYLKREDLCHTGAHKINNTIGQILLAKKLHKKRIVAETGAGQHGVATATVAAKMGFSCVIYMGVKDMARQEMNVKRMQLLGAEVRGVTSGTQTLKDATNEAIRDWVTNVRDTFYVLGSVVGPHPYPTIVRNFQRVIGDEARKQILEQEHRLPDILIASVGGGSNSIGLFYPFLKDKVTMYGVEAAGLGIHTKHHAATLTKGRPGVLHGSYSYLLQDGDGQVLPAHSISAGLDYPGVGPEHSFLKETGRVNYVSVTDAEALEAVADLMRLEGILPALESAHALAYLKKLKPNKSKRKTVIIVNLSGRGEKDLPAILQHLK